MFKVFRCPCGISFGITSILHSSIDKLIQGYNSTHQPATLHGSSGVVFTVSTQNPGDFIKYTQEYFRRKGLTAKVRNTKRIGKEVIIEFEVGL